MSEAEDNYSDTFRRALCKLLDDEAVEIERPGARRLAVCIETLDRICQLIGADAERDRDRASAALSKEQMPQLQLEHRATDALKIANDRTKVLTLVMAALAEGANGRWPALFPEQKHDRGGQVDGEHAVLRGYLAGELEYADRLKFFKGLTEPAGEMAKELNRLRAARGKRIKAQQIIDWRQQMRSVTTAEDSPEKTVYGAVLKAWLSEEDQPRTKKEAISTLRHLVRFCLNYDPRRRADEKG